MPPRYRRDFLLQRARYRCEYCHFPEARLALALYVDHIIARQHGGGDEEENLAMACEHCNACKGPNLSSIDACDGKAVWLFHPRKDEWTAHFEISEDEIRGRTPSGRATASLLDMNSGSNVLLRRLIRLLGAPIKA
jgi:hypothetical protein